MQRKVETDLCIFYSALFPELLFQSLLLGKNHLAQSQRSGGYFKQFVIFDEFHALFKA